MTPAALNLAFGAIALFGLLLFAGVGGWVALGPGLKRDRVLRQRVSGMGRYRQVVAEGGDSLFSKPQDGRDAVVWLQPYRERLEFRLLRTGRSITITQYLIVSVVIAVIVGSLFGWLLRFGPMLGTLCGLLVGIGLPSFWIGRMGRKRIARFMSLLPDAIDLMVRALRSGLPITEAIVNAGHEVADPVGAEFRRVESALRIGHDLNDVLWESARRLDIPEFRFFVISLAIQRETGGNLAETLATLADMLRRRRQMKLKIKSLSSEARASAMILGALPFAVIAGMFFTSPTYVGRLFTDPRGLILCGAGVFLMAIGIMVMAKLIDFEI